MAVSTVDDDSDDVRHMGRFGRIMGGDRRRSSASTAIVVLSSAAIVAAAFTADGFHNTQVELHEGGVWVTRGDNELSRVNTQVQRFDSYLLFPQTGVHEIHQDGTLVLAHVGNRLLDIDGKAVTADRQGALPPNADVAIGGPRGNEVIAFTDPASGGVWAFPANAAFGFDPEKDLNSPMFASTPGSKVAIGSDGRVMVVSPRDKVVHEIDAGQIFASSRPNGVESPSSTSNASTSTGVTSSANEVSGRPSVVHFTTRDTQLDVEIDPSSFTVVAVGTEPVVLTGSKVIIADNAPVDISQFGRDPILQQPGATEGPVRIATETSLVSVPLDGRAPSVVRDGAPGAPAAPLVRGSCVEAAWASSTVTNKPLWIAQCGDGEVQTRDAQQLPRARPVSIRENRGLVVLNSEDGTVIIPVTDGTKVVDNWDEVAHDSTNTQKGSNGAQIGDTATDCVVDGPNQAPKAADDDFGARPGVPTILRPMGNDEDTNCDVLTIDPVSIKALPVAVGAVDIVDNGEALQFTAAAGTEGRTVTLSYVAFDGHPDGRSSVATVTLHVRRPDENGPPKLRKEGAQPKTQVQTGKQVSYDVLADWVDPDGDFIRLVSAALTPDMKTQHAVRSGNDGRFTFIAGPVGEVPVTVAVADDRGAAGTPIDVQVTVRSDQDALAPIAHNDVVTGFVGQDIVVHPLVNDVDPNDDAIILRSVAPEQAGLVFDPIAGTVTLHTDQPGTYVVRYVIEDSPQTTADPSSDQGVIRFNVVASDSPHAPVAMVDRVVVPVKKTVNLDVLRNDTDVDGDVLVVTDVSIDASLSGVATVSLLEGRAVRITANSEASTAKGVGSGSFTFAYTVTDGERQSKGTVSVQIVAAPTVNSPPVVRPDRVAVRVGDVVSIPVLDNDSDPDGDPLTILPDIPQNSTLQGRFDTDGKTVRFHAPDQSGVVRAEYSVVDPSGDRSGRQITVDVLGLSADDLKNNRPPAVPPVQARVVSGSKVTIVLPLERSDPDGDSVTLKGSGKQPSTKGKVDLGKDGRSISYAPFANSVGTDDFTIAVQDRFGATAEAHVRVGVAPRPTVNQHPVAVDDLVPAKPGTKIAVDVLANDTDVEDGRPTLASEQNWAPDIVAGFEPSTAEDRIVINVPSDKGTRFVPYAAVDSAGQSATAYVELHIDPVNTGMRPVPLDDDARQGVLTPAQTSVQVDVRANDADPDTLRTSLEVGPWDDREITSVRAVALKPGFLEFDLQDMPAVVPYKVQDAEGNKAMGIVRLPARPRPVEQAPGANPAPIVNQAPHLKANVPAISTAFETPVTIRIDTFVVDPEGKQVKLLGASTLKATNGTGSSSADELTLTFVPTAGYSGQASISFEATDGAGPEDPTAAKNGFQLPIEVLARENRPPTATDLAVSVEQGGDAISVDLAKQVSDPDAGDVLTTSVPIAAGSAQPGIKGEMVAGKFAVTADPSVPTGTTASWTFTGSDSKAVSAGATLTVTVIRTTKLLPRVASLDLGKLNNSQAKSQNVLIGAIDPIGKGLHVGDVTPIPAAQGVVRLIGTDTVEVAPAASFHGSITVTYSVLDGTNDPTRSVTATLTANVIGVPEQPVAPTVTEVRSHVVVLQWQPPAMNGGTFDSYTVQVFDVTTGSPIAQPNVTGVRTTTTSISSLVNGRSYRFRVIALNEAGQSPASADSPSAKPDQIPDPVGAPTAAFVQTSLGQALDVSWPVGVVDGSPITSYEVRSVPAMPGGTVPLPAGTTTYHATGLANGTAYQFQVRAINDAGPGGWSTLSGPQTPAGIPAVPGAPTPQHVNDPAGGRVSVSWTAPANNGDAIRTYTLQVFQGGSLLTTVPGILGTASSQEVRDLSVTGSYTFNLRATNKAGDSAYGPMSPVVVPFSRPGSITVAPQAIATGSDGQIRLVFTAPAANGSPITRYRVTTLSAHTGPSTSDYPATLPIVVNGLYNRYVWWFTVQACNQVDNAYCGDPSPQSNQEMPYGPVGTPSVSGSKLGATQVQFNWSAPASNGRPIQYFEISVNDGAWQNVGLATSSTQGNGLGQVYWLSVRSVDSVGQVGGAATTPHIATDPQPTPPTTWAETTGGVTHTWTNYSNAGGTEGQQIATHTTVQIACRLTGFAVANGNTWWYRIGQSPWNGAYYASADAFYNNGATSGSLVGTPYFDPAVPLC